MTTALDPITADATRREFLALLGAAGLLTGCATPTAAPTAPTRTVDGPFGPMTIPTDPRRVVTGYDTDTDFALVLGLPIIGAPGARGSADRPFPRYQPVDRLAGVERVQTFPEVSAESIAALAPDLVLDSISGSDRARYDLMSAVAPTLTATVDPTQSGIQGWQDTLRAYADALGRPERATEAIAQFDARVAAVRERMTGRWGANTTTFALLVSVPGGFTMVTSEYTLSPAVLAAVGLVPSARTPATFAEETVTSLEQVVDVLGDVDLLVLTVPPTPGGEGRDPAVHDALRASPLWGQLPAVATGQVYEIDAELQYPSPLTALAALDWVERILLADT